MKFCKSIYTTLSVSCKAQTGQNDSTRLQKDFIIMDYTHKLPQ